LNIKIISYVLVVAGGRTGATLQPQQAVYVQSQQQPNVQYQMVQVINSNYLQGFKIKN